MGAKLTPLAVAVLSLLHEKTMHPYEMAQLMRERFTDHHVKVKAGSLYHTVDRLAAAELIEVVGTQRDGKRPERTVYGITPAGRDAVLERARAMLSTPAEEYPEFVNGLSLIDELGAEEAIVELRRRELELATGVAADQVILAKLHEQQVAGVHQLHWRYSAARREFELEWTRQLIDDLKHGRISWHEDKPALTLLTEDGSGAQNG
ncbi:PadR family transcriptional regulator [Amycolatopsis sp. 195334CR]|uniref:PadR family transcriptional regulator n=1 Tax=Amycolatopsis sp. 195334CR TaxID=2814588 RepID=UPI001A8F28C9|nr:PadR family transcriptional regulator [Amycolatopsis sp. 195334CR]MBN6036598.1 PadR family transcriptional regulator [Amycolatopsis sp. 195334CR]